MRQYTNTHKEQCVSTVRTILHAHWHCVHPHILYKEWSDQPVSAMEGLWDVNQSYVIVTARGIVKPHSGFL